MQRLAWVLLVVLAACGGRYRKLPDKRAAIPVTRAPTAGEPALAMLPSGPDIVVEIDLARARENPLVGPLIDGWIGALEDGDLPVGGPRPPLAGAAWVVLAAYGVGGDDATTVTLLAPGPGAEVPGGVALADGVVVLAPPAWVDRVRAVTAGEASIADDDPLLALRSRAMPSAAEGAVVRITARLSADARIALAGVLGIEPAPRAVSAWLDVADDAAVIVDLDARDDSDPAATKRLRVGLERLLQRIAARPEVRALGLAVAVANTRIESTPRGTWLRAVTVVSPKRLKWAVSQARGGAQEATP
jgi:hypothetical protein